MASSSILTKAYSEFEDLSGESFYMFVELSPLSAQLALKVQAKLKELAEELDIHIFSIKISVGHVCVFNPIALIDARTWAAWDSPFYESMRYLMEALDENAIITNFFNLKPFDEDVMRTSCSVCHITDHGIFFECYPKHGSGSYTSDYIPQDLLEEIANLTFKFPVLYDQN